MIPEKLLEILKHRMGLLPIAPWKGWAAYGQPLNSYIRYHQTSVCSFPAAYMPQTEANIAYNPNVLITLEAARSGLAWGCTAT